MFVIVHTATSEETWTFINEREALHFYNQHMTAAERAEFHIEELQDDV